MERGEEKSERVIVTLPRDVARELREFAARFRGGNKSGFVADAIRSHVQHLRKVRHTARLRESYAASVHAARAVASEWAAVDEESWVLLDEPARKRRSR